MNQLKYTIGLLVLLILCGLGDTVAQTAKAQGAGKGNQDSVLFHQSMMSGGNSMATTNELMAGTTSSTGYSGSFTVGGNASSYYPVTFDDGGWNLNDATVLKLGRSSVHENGTWHGSLIAAFRFHVTLWGHGTSFIDTDIKQQFNPFIAGWQDVTANCGEAKIVIWLRGGSTYHYHCNYPQTPAFTSGSLTVCNIACGVKSQPDNYVNSYGPTFSNNLWVAGSQPNYFAGNVGIGTDNPTHKLDVRGAIRANEVVVNSGGADFVFAPGYRLRSLPEVEQFIATKKHLPDIAPADSMVQHGVDLGDMQVKLLQKVEELTLYVIEQEKRNEALKQQVQVQQKEIEQLKNKK